jgi:hypothetical protein
MDNGMLINSQYDALNKSDEINNSKIESESYNNNNNKAQQIKIEIPFIDNNNNNNKHYNINLSDSTAENSNNAFVVNDNIVQMVSELGYRKEDIIKWLDKNELNQATTAYYLFLNYESIQ